MAKAIIGISGSELIDNGGIFPGYRRSYVNQDYVDSVIQNGGVPYIIPFNMTPDVIAAQVAQLDGLILSGGHDVDPHGYGEEPQQKLGDIWPERDQFDMTLLKLAEARKLPILGICRGAQIINVAHGGSLYQDLSYRTKPTLKHEQGQRPDLMTHTIKVARATHLAEVLGKTEFQSNSFHHQLIKDVAPDLIASAHAADGVTEGLESHDGRILAVQWHPEMLHRNSREAFMNRLFQHLM